jgi:hypothetical protein
VRDRRPLVSVLCALAVTTALGFSWIVELPLHYTRMAYYLTLALIPLIAAVAGSMPRPALRGAVALALAATTAIAAWSQADSVRRIYQFADDASERGLGHVSAALRPREVVVTDRCWSFLGTWLLRTRTLPALNPVDIQPKAELPFARRAHAVLDGTPRGEAIADRLGIRFAIVEPHLHGRSWRPAGAAAGGKAGVRERAAGGAAHPFSLSARDVGRSHRGRSR